MEHKANPYVLSFTLFALMLFTTAHADQKLIYLDQNWTMEQRYAFYYTSQGSYILPYNWYLALEQPEKKKLLIDERNIERLRYIPDENELYNPDGLPIGFAKEEREGEEPWLGYSCAACHTAQLTFRDKTIRIDGAPTLADFTTFNTQLVESLEATAADAEKFRRFANRVLLKSPNQTFDQLKDAVQQHAQVLRNILTQSTPNHEYGYGRVDALGIIMNEVLFADLQQPDNYAVPSAPVSYPHLWTTPFLDWVQWNGSVNNPIGRNVGEVLGTFGSVTLTGERQNIGNTSARADNLLLLERLLYTLKSPQWPEELFGEIDLEKAERGKILYSEYRGEEPSCESCHSLPDENGQYPMTPAEENLFGVQFIETTMTGLSDIGTDPTAALNFATSVSLTGALAPLLPAPYTGASELPAPLLLNLAVGIAVQNSIAKLNPPLTQAEFAEIIGYRVAAPGLPPYTPRNLLAYRARPLNGIWATAPFLHNGSVANLYELLLPPELRSKIFYLGSREFDARRIGLQSIPRRHAFKFDTSLPGNFNGGHEYGTTLSESDRWDLIEYLKSL